MATITEKLQADLDAANEKVAAAQAEVATIQAQLSAIPAELAQIEHSAWDRIVAWVKAL